MKNNLPAFLFGTAMMVVMPPAAQAQSPATISLPQGGQFRLSISNTDPNMIFIPGDKVTAITAPGGMLADKRLTTAGGVLFTSVATRTFTIFVETALGQTFSVVATPVKGEGRVYRLMSAEPPSRPETRKWETAQAYEKLLISLNRAVLTGDIPDGYGEVKPLSDGIRLPGGFSVTPLKAWAGDQLRADRYELRNANTWGVALREQDFWKPGVRAVMFDNNAQTLMGGGRMTVTVTAPDGPDACFGTVRLDYRPAGGHPDGTGEHRPLYGHSGVCRGGENHPVPGGDGGPEHPVCIRAPAGHRPGTDAPRRA